MQVPVKSVLCPTDASDTSDAAIDVAYELVADGGVVHLLHVCQPPMLGNPLYPPYDQGYVPSPTETEAGKAAVRERMAAEVPHGTGDRRIVTEIHLVDGLNPGQTIREQAQVHGAELVVMGTHGRSGFSRLVLGSVASDVMKEGLPCVLVYDKDARS